MIRRAALGLVLMIAAEARADTRGATPEPSPTEEAEASLTAAQGQDDKASDAEADYLALADAPIFLPRSYLYWGSPVGAGENQTPLVFALEYALHLSVYSDVREKALLGKRWAGAVTLSFEGDLRMLSQTSNPVRMPSYRPNLSGQLFHLVNGEHPLLLGLRAGVYHYSNGQEQCLFERALRDETADCRARFSEVRDPARELNRLNGSFSTNGWLLELFARVHRRNSRGVAVGHLAGGFSAYGMIHQGPGAMEPALQRMYGWGRLQTSLEGKLRMGWATATLRVQHTYYPGTHLDVPAHSGGLEGVLGPYWLAGIGFFARYVGGRDFYNAFFVDRLQQFAAGVAWDGERPLKFKVE
jgi:hypothetical protein